MQNASTCLMTTTTMTMTRGNHEETKNHYRNRNHHPRTRTTTLTTTCCDLSEKMSGGRQSPEMAPLGRGGPKESQKH